VNHVEHNSHDRRDESIAVLVKDLSRDVSQLVREEIALARVEMTEKGKQAGVGVGMLSAAAVFGLATLGGTMATIIILLDLVMPLWLAALITTAVYGAVTAGLAMRGRNELKEAGTPVPEHARDSVKEDIRWATTRARSNNE
jgi:uncharacterized membrane protein YqjE